MGKSISPSKAFGLLIIQFTVPNHMTVPPSRPYEETDIIRGLREDPEYAAAYLELVLNEGSEDEIALVRRRIAAAFDTGALPPPLLPHIRLFQ